MTNKVLKVAGDGEYKLIKEAYESVKNKMPYKPTVALVLGSGLGNLVDKIKVDKSIDFDEIKNLPKATNKSHKGRYVFTKINGVETVIMQGRIHYYEGYNPFETIRPIRLLALMGIKKIILTNASGGIKKDFNAGDLILLKDLITFLVPNPLRGKNVEELGTRFPDMSEPFDSEINKKVLAIAKKIKIKLKEGIYVQTPGPTFETAAEIRLLKSLGADCVAMSLGIEVIAAVHAGIKVCGISMVTNKATGLRKGKQSDEEVRSNAEKYGEKFCKLILNIIPKI